MNVLVVGGAGFIGSHLCDALLEAGDRVVCVDNFSLGTRKNIEHLKNHTAFILYEADATDKKKMSEIFREENVEQVFHLAANSDIQASAEDPEVEYRNTYTTTFRVLACMREYHVRKLFFASTSAVYGNKGDELLDENTPNLNPVSYYGAAKLGSEALISAFSYMNDIDALVLRFPNVIGPRLTHGVVFDFIHKLEHDNRNLNILGNGKQRKPYIYITDLVDAIMKFRAPRESGVTLYNVGVEGATSVTVIADIVCEEMGLKDVVYHYTGGEGGWKGDVPRFRYCVDKIHGAGWKANYTSDEAVRETVRRNINR